MSKKSPSRPVPEPNRPDLEGILGRFSDARAVIETACRAMENTDDHTIETSALRSGLSMLDAVYDELDLAIAKLSPAVSFDDTP